MKLKTVTIYRKGYSWSRNPSEGAKELQGYFLHTRCTGDYNRVHYMDKPADSTRKEFRQQTYFVPFPEKEFMPALIRGKTFFSKTDGVLFGAMVELKKMGEFVTFPAC